MDFLPPPNPAGSLINHRYQIQQLLGKGGFGQTYLAYDTQRFNQACVLKEFAPASRAEYAVQKARELFEREARVLYEIDHPQIPKFLAWFVERERLFLVQEYIAGKTYAQLLRQRQAFSEPEVLRWLLNLLPVLHYLHQRRMVHRDISPDNIMQPDQAAKPILIDFGLVKQTLSQLQSQVGGSASFVGKFGYAPPEQMRLGQCYPSSDLYALGVTALVLLTGQEPRLLMDQETLEWHWRDYVTVSPGFASILEQMLQEKPKARYQTATDVIQALRAVITTDLTWTPDTAMRLANSSPASRPALSSAFLQRCRQELIQRIGPIADFILETTLAQYPNLTEAELLERLALEIPDSSQANHFRSILSTDTFTATSTVPFAATNSSQLSQNSTRMSADAQRLSSTPAVITPDFLERCQQALTRCIGPVASLVLDDLIQQAHLSPQALVEAIIAEIPDPQQAKQFRELMNSMS